MEHESAGGILLVIATLLALGCDNSFLSPWYDAFQHIPIELRIGALHLDKPLYHWVNDGLMAIFFLYIGLEVKREMLEGHLASAKQIVLPGVAAAGGMLVPAAIYLLYNHADPVAVDGWAIPTATDIAFALGILSLLGRRVPPSLKIFLMALAILDDLGAIVIIALFYTAKLSMVSISIAAIALGCLIFLNRQGVTRISPYLVFGVILWVSVLKSGVHATLAGVALAFTIPLHVGKDQDSPLPRMEHTLQPWVTLCILPLFAFVNAGVNISSISLSQMTGNVPMGILLGLFVGKQLGVFGFSWLAIRLGYARLPAGSHWLQFHGVCVLTGIGFTMSLFITSLAFVQDDLFQYTDKLAILIGSLCSATVGYALLRLSRSS